MGAMSKLFTRIKVVLKAAPTYLILASTAISLTSAQVAELLPGQAEDIARWTAPIVTALAVIVVIVRSVTTVLPEHRNLTTNVPYAPVPPVPAGEVPFEKIPYSPSFLRA